MSIFRSKRIDELATRCYTVNVLLVQGIIYTLPTSRKIYHISCILSRGFIRILGNIQKMKDWAFITNHGLVLSYLAEHLQITSREIAAALGITERRVQRIISDLEQAGYITKKRTGRYNTYVVNTAMSMRHPSQRDRAVGDLLTVLKPRPAKKKPTPAEMPRLFPDIEFETPTGQPQGELVLSVLTSSKEA